MPSTSWGRLAVPAPVLALLGMLAAALVVVFSLPVLGRGEWADGVAETSLAVAAALGLGSLLRRAFGVDRPGPAAVAADGRHRRRPGCLGGLRRAARALDPLARDAPGRHRRRRPGPLAAAEPAHHPARPGPAGDRRCRCGVRVRDPRRRAGAARGWPHPRQRGRPPAPGCRRAAGHPRGGRARPVAAPGRAGGGPVRRDDPGRDRAGRVGPDVPGRSPRDALRGHAGARRDALDRRRLAARRRRRVGPGDPLAGAGRGPGAAGSVVRGGRGAARVHGLRPPTRPGSPWRRPCCSPRPWWPAG